VGCVQAWKYVFFGTGRCQSMFRMWLRFVDSVSDLLRSSVSPPRLEWSNEV